MSDGFKQLINKDTETCYKTKPKQCPGALGDEELRIEHSHRGDIKDITHKPQISLLSLPDEPPDQCLCLC